VFYSFSSRRSSSKESDDGDDVAASDDVRLSDRDTRMRHMSTAASRLSFNYACDYIAHRVKCYMCPTPTAFIALPRHSSSLFPLWNDWPEIDGELCQSNISYRRRRHTRPTNRAARRRRAVRDSIVFILYSSRAFRVQAGESPELG